MKSPKIVYCETAIDRIYDKKNDTYLTEAQYEDIANGEDDDNFTDSMQVELSIKGSYSFIKGVFWASPEKCYPDETETEIISVVDKKGKDWKDLLTEDEKESILQLIASDAADE
jgi:hypothetical protein